MGLGRDSSRDWKSCDHSRLIRVEASGVAFLLIGFDKVVPEPELVEIAVGRLQDFFRRLLLPRQQPTAFSVPVAENVPAWPDDRVVVVVGVKHAQRRVVVDEAEKVRREISRKPLVSDVELASILAGN